MPRFDNGYISVQRRCIDGDIGHDPILFTLWVRLISWANIAEGRAHPRLNDSKIKRGEILTSYNELVASFEPWDKMTISAKRIRRRLEYLRQTDRIGLEQVHRGIKITLLNYDFYQGQKNQADVTRQSEGAPRAGRGHVEGTHIEKENNKIRKHISPEGTKVPPGSQITPVSLFNSSLQGDIETPKVDTHTGPKKRGGKPKTPTAGAEVWESYRAAYLIRYGVEPARSAKVNAICSRLAKDIGAEEAKSVAAYYVTHNDRWYINKGHDLKYCLGDAQKLLTEFQRGGIQVTSATAGRMDLAQSNRSAIRDHLKRKYGDDNARALL